jgi:hypothetical protein
MHAALPSARGAADRLIRRVPIYAARRQDRLPATLAVAGTREHDLRRD